MFTSHFDSLTLKAVPAKDHKRLDTYRTYVEEALDTKNYSVPEASLYYSTDEALLASLQQSVAPFRKHKYVVVIGIGGSALGLEAVHEALGEGEVQLGIIDMITPQSLEHFSELVSTLKKVTDIVVCVISKSGATTETLANASIALRMLADTFGADTYKQTIFIGDAGTAFMKSGAKLGVTTIAMPTVIGGRFSVATECGLVPLLLLGHDVEQFVAGYGSASSADYEASATESALRLYAHVQSGYRHYNFFAFTERLESLGRWYRQLMAESIGKATKVDGSKVSTGWVPTISTPVELHSIGQLYMSGFPGVYTDFVSLDDNSPDYKVGPSAIAPHLKKFTLEEVSAALYGGVIAAYQSKQLAHRATILSEDIPFSIGLFMGMRIRETMYLATLLQVNAFDQPDVELYKQKTRELLGL